MRSITNVYEDNYKTPTRCKIGLASCDELRIKQDIETTPLSSSLASNLFPN
jgi:hypothetical protein